MLAIPVALHIGRQNAEATLAALRSRGIQVRGTDLGGTVGRTVRFNPAAGTLAVRLVSGEQVML